MTLNPIVSESISGAGVLLKTYSKIRNFRKKKSSYADLLSQVMKKFSSNCDPL